MTTGVRRGTPEHGQAARSSLPCGPRASDNCSGRVPGSPHRASSRAPLPHCLPASSPLLPQHVQHCGECRHHERRRRSLRRRADIAPTSSPSKLMATSKIRLRVSLRANSPETHAFVVVVVVIGIVVVIVVVVIVTVTVIVMRFW